jgi:hypothetical protein
MLFEEVNEDLYSDVSCGILLVSDEFGYEVFEYAGDEERMAAARNLHYSVIDTRDEIERNIAFVTDGELTYVGSFDGSAWEHFELPSSNIKASV